MLWSKVTCYPAHWPDSGPELPFHKGPGHGGTGNGRPATLVSPHPAPRSPNVPLTFPCTSDFPSPGGAPHPHPQPSLGTSPYPGSWVVSRNGGPCASLAPGPGGASLNPRTFTLPTGNRDQATATTSWGRRTQKVPSSPCPARQVLQGTLSREWAALGPWLRPQKSILILSSWPPEHGSGQEALLGGCSAQPLPCQGCVQVSSPKLSVLALSFFGSSVLTTWWPQHALGSSSMGLQPSWMVTAERCSTLPASMDFGKLRSSSQLSQQK